LVLTINPMDEFYRKRYTEPMLWMMTSCFTQSEQEFAVIDQPTESLCDRMPNAIECMPEDEGFEPIPQDEDPEDFPPEDTSCNSAMRIRKVIPLANSTAPVNTKPIVLTIGNGDETHMAVDLKMNGQSIPHDQEVTCYIHEGDEEYHCTYLVLPYEDLEPNTDYYVSVLTTDIHAEPGIDSGAMFRTSTEKLTMSAQAPATEFLGYMDRELTAVQECDWKDAKKYEILTTVDQVSTDNLSMIQVYEVYDPSIGDEAFMHSIILPKDLQFTNYRQVIRPGEEYPLRCFRAVHRDVAGNESPSSETICWD
jgi:hypothetical protein